MPGHAGLSGAAQAASGIMRRASETVTSLTDGILLSFLPTGREEARRALVPVHPPRPGCRASVYRGLRHPALNSVIPRGERCDRRLSRAFGTAATGLARVPGRERESRVSSSP